MSPHLKNTDEHAPLTLTCAMEFEAEQPESAAEGKAPLPRFSMVAYTGGAMRLAEWRYPVVVDLAGMSVPSQNRPIRFGHDAFNGVGHTDSIKVLGNQLIATGVVSRDTLMAREVVVSSRNGFPWQASIGATVVEAEFLKENQKTIVNGQEVTGPVNIVRKSVLGEISFVDLGADGRTSASIAATAQKREAVVEKEAKEAVQTEKKADPTVAEAAGAVHAQQTDLAARMRVEAADETERIANIRTICGGQHPQIESQAIREGWDATRCELEVLRANRPKAPAVLSGKTGALTPLLLEAACAQSGKLPNLEESFDERTLEAASKRFHGRLSLHELFMEAAWANGYSERSIRMNKDVLRFAFGRDVRAGLSSIDIGGILSNIANKFLLDGFFSVERVWRNICSVRNVSDFKTVTSYRLIGKDRYEQVAPTGELKHGTLGEEKFAIKADTYGLILTIDRRDLINDDLGAITQIPRKLGRGSGQKINEVFWRTFLNNAAFFSVANKNFLAGVDTALSIDGLTKAEVAFNEQVDGEGNPIGVMPAIVLAPLALSAYATQLFKSLELRDSTSSKFPVSNPFQNRFRVEVSRYLSNVLIPGNSSKAWYLIADPNDLPIIEVAFLNGQESPTVETADADFNTLGIQMRGYHDFGVALQDPRGGVKSKGEV